MRIIGHFVSLLIASFASMSIATGQDEALLDYQGCGYVSGKDLEMANKPLIDFEKGFFVSVPKNYKNPTEGTIRIYAFFANGYDPAKPTLSIFMGGPGQSAHQHHKPKLGFYKGLGFNFLLFDQRGIGFSRWESEREARDARNYSSESTARDLARILDFLKINQTTVYGPSYGAVPATIFGNLFPARTRSVVLEGTVFDGMSGVMARNDREQLIQKYYDSLDQDVRTKLTELIVQQKISDTWFPMMLSSLMAQYGSTSFSFFKRVLRVALIENNGQDEDALVKAYNEESAKPAAAPVLMPVTIAPSAGHVCRNVVDSEDVNHLLMLKEFDAGVETVSALLALRDGRVVRIPGGNYSPLKGHFTNLPTGTSAYLAARYPLQVPVFYLHGEFDTAAPVAGAFEHFKLVPQGKAQLLFFQGLAHMPTGSIITGMKNPTQDWALLQKTFAQLFLGIPLTCEEISELEKSYALGKTRVMRKGAAPVCGILKTLQTTVLPSRDKYNRAGSEISASRR